MATELEYEIDEELSDAPDTMEKILFGDKEARWFQVAALHGVEAALEANPCARILVVQPTGTGKTVTSGLIFTSDLIRKVLNIPAGRKLRLLFIAHTHRLLTQAERTYAHEHNVEFIAHSAFSDLPEELIAEGWDICCIDEAHHEAMATIQYHLDKIGDRPIVGLTATPDRSDGCLIKFEVIIEPISREEAVSQGYLAPTHIHSFVDAPNDVKTEMVCDILENFGHQMGKTMVFMRTRKEVQDVATFAQYLGINAVAILNQTAAQINELIDAFDAGRVQMLINCNRINEGVDVKGCTDVVLAKQYGSYTQLNQVIGRAARPDSDCNVWELIDPLSARNLDTTVIVGTPESHRLVSKERGKWVEREFDYTSDHTSSTLQIIPGLTA